ncbi:hypothetical protein WOSG25_021740 [Weissella oryzae SG25]|uniref:HTH arsR-type domain-containing protein n=1 Tax=Weissella oryzae (strain DSM 25784 / JCM 18191 / LMG 30913 / SG25) TaxID=1329250 RepID=A0A069CSK8_WEIOS|nr:metalloregulator ArsR/SmtB family transcription factor [Weissella oryzae]GAK30377.1 hypothetical protein WOSG25_021740 [Weissella oryzae SG25]
MDKNEKLVINKAENVLKVLSSSTRMNILLLLEQKPMTVNELVEQLKISQPAVSKQLRLLREYQIVSFNKQGKESLYGLEDLHILNVINSTMEHAKHVLAKEDCNLAAK